MKGLIRADWTHAILGKFEGVRVLRKTSDQFWLVWVPELRTTFVARDNEIEFIRE